MTTSVGHTSEHPITTASFDSIKYRQIPLSVKILLEKTDMPNMLTVSEITSLVVCIQLESNKILVTLLGIIALVNWFEEKALCPILVTLFGIVMLANWFPAKALDPILVTLFGIVMLVNWFPLKAPYPIRVTLFGIVMLVNWFPEKALDPILVTLFGIVTLVNWFPAKI